MNRGARAGRTLRVQKVMKPCPTCKVDIADFLANCQVNRSSSATLSVNIAMTTNEFVFVYSAILHAYRIWDHHEDIDRSIL